MNESSGKIQATVSYEDRMEIMLQELGLAIRWQRPCIMLVSYDSVYVRSDAVSLLENHLMDLDQKVVWINASDPVVNSLGFWHKLLDEAENEVFFLDGFADLGYQTGFLGIFNHHLHIFTERNVRFVFWLTHKEASTIAYQAPAVWIGRQRLIELTAPPKPEQILQTALESAWQGTGEYNDRFDDTDARISLRESFLTGLPDNREATSIRANLLLTLGVLHWRKGDYEKAIDTLENALKFAAEIQDNLFEAKCLNAIALVQSSLGKNEEAIDSYKQAITLAPEQIFAWNNLGNLCLKIGRNHEAMIAFQKAIEHNAADPVAWTGMGDVYSRSEYVDDAIASYRKSIELAPSLPYPWNGLGEIYAYSGRFDDAVKAFQKAIKLNTHFIQPWLGLARLYSRQNHHREASRAYQCALKIDPKNSVLWNDLGCSYLEARHYEEAIEAISKAIELDRGYGWAYSNLALAYAGHEKAGESVPLYLKSLDLLRNQEQRSTTWNRLANSYRMLNDYGSAIKAYQMADSLNADISLDFASASNDPKPDPVSNEGSAPETKSNVAEERSENESIQEQADRPTMDPENEMPYWIFQPAEEVDDTVAELFQSPMQAATPAEAFTQETGGTTMQMILPFTANRRARKPEKISPADTGNARMWNEKGNLFLRSGAFDDAIHAYNKAIKYDRSFGWAYTNLGVAYLQLGRYAEAVLLLQKSLEFLSTDSEKAVAWNGLGNLYRCLNDYHNAVIAYQKADELDPGYVGTHDTVEYLHAEPNLGNAKVWNELGDTFFESGSYSEASNCYRKVIEMAPRNGWAFNNLALSLAHQAKYEEAVPLYLKSIELFEDDKEKAEAWNRLGNVYRRLNDYDNAIAAYKNAVKLSTDVTLLTRTRFSLLGNCTVN